MASPILFTLLKSCWSLSCSWNTQSLFLLQGHVLPVCSSWGTWNMHLAFSSTSFISLFHLTKAFLDHSTRIAIFHILSSVSLCCFLLFLAYFIRRRQCHRTPVLLPGTSHGWRSLEGFSPWGREELDTTERLHFHFSLSCTGEGNGNPLQSSCLENPRAGGACWAAVYGVAQSGTRLKWLSSSSSNSVFHYTHICDHMTLHKNINDPWWLRW